MPLLQAEEATGESAPASSLFGGFLHSLKFIEICLVLGGQKLHVACRLSLNDESGSAAFPVNLTRYADVSKLCDSTKSLEHPNVASTKDMKHG